MSKAFTKEDDDGGVAVTSAASWVAPSGSFRITAQGAQLLATSGDERQRSALARAEVLAPIASTPDRAALGVTVRVRSGDGGAHAYRLVTPEEQGLLGEGCSIQSPLGRSLLGAQVGDVCEVRTPRGASELEVIALDGESATS